MLRLLAFIVAPQLAASLRAAEPAAPDYTTRIAPLFAKYCSACHNPDEAEGKLNLESFAELQKGGKHGPAVLPGDGTASRMVRMLTGQAKPQMPPEGNEAPQPAEIELLTAWIDAGAKGPQGAEPDRRSLIVPQIAPAKDGGAGITAVAWSASGELIAAAQFGRVELRRGSDRELLRAIDQLPGKVNSLEFTPDSTKLVTASGVSGLYGKAAIWNAADGQLIREFTGHRDTMYAARLSSDGKLLATASYDRKLILWNAETGEIVRTIDVHNDAIYDAAFSPAGDVLASASGDNTVKLWRVSDGERLDTLSQPLAEQYAVAFSPDGKSIVGGGVDNRIRVWQFVSREKPQINPVAFARFAHEGAIVRLAFSPNGALLASASEDRTVKLWETKSFTQVQAWPAQSDVPSAVAFSPNGQQVLVGRMDGSLEVYAVQPAAAEAAEPMVVAIVLPDRASAPMQTVAEAEPNDSAASAGAIPLPATITGAIHATVPTATGPNQSADADFFRFEAKRGEAFILEVNAARSGSPLDSKLAVLDAEGRPVPRVLLKAVRDSYLTFRGVDGSNRQFRLHNWEEMSLNQYLYTKGEVVKLFLAPRGPDSGFDMYPEGGSRYTFFDTTALAHALHTTCYVVEAYPPQAKPAPNGLPQFIVNYENDDDSLRQLGSDSRLTFTAPADGAYLVRLSDVRGQQGEAYKYTLTIRAPQPSFSVAAEVPNREINAGSGKKIQFRVNRIDSFDGEVRIDVGPLPAGFRMTPVVIQAGHNVAQAALYADAGAAAPATDAFKGVELKATATIGGQEVVKAVDSLGEIKLAAAPKVIVKLLPLEGDSPELVIQPGQTISARVVIERNGFDDRIGFNPQNLPHGVIVDNIGLNGVLIPEGTTERQIFLTADPWVPETSRTFFLEATSEGNQTSNPVTLHVRRPAEVASETNK